MSDFETDSKESEARTASSRSKSRTIMADIKQETSKPNTYEIDTSKEKDL